MLHLYNTLYLKVILRMKNLTSWLFGKEKRTKLCVQHLCVAIPLFTDSASSSFCIKYRCKNILKRSIVTNLL